MKLKFMITFIATFILLYIPVVSNLFKGINTLFHEVGHAMMTLMTDGKVKSISLFYNTEGVTYSYTDSWFDSILTSISGYLTTSIMVLLFCFLWKKGFHKTILSILLTTTIVALVLWVRNVYGFIWIIGFGVLLFGLLKIKEKHILSSITLIFIAILFTQSFQSTVDIFMLSYMTPNQAGDASNLAQVTLIPAVVYGVMFFVQSLIFSLLSLYVIFKKDKTKKAYQ